MCNNLNNNRCICGVVWSFRGFVCEQTRAGLFWACARFIRSQNNWLRHSHNVFKAVLGKDKERLHRGGAWEFAKKNWKQNELDFVNSYFDKTAKVDEAYIELKAHHKNKLNFMFACFFDSEKEIKNVNLSNLPDNWHHFYQPVIDRLQETNATNVLEYIHGSSLLQRASSPEESLGAGE